MKPVEVTIISFKPIDKFASRSSVVPLINKNQPSYVQRLFDTVMRSFGSKAGWVLVAFPSPSRTIPVVATLVKVTGLAEVSQGMFTSILVL